MNPKAQERVVEIAGYLKDHAEAIWKMPASEQFIGARDAALHSALLQISEALKLLAGHAGSVPPR